MATEIGVKLLEETFPEYVLVDYGFGHFWGYKTLESDPEKII
jgi:hypothetical protein